MNKERITFPDLPVAFDCSKYEFFEVKGMTKCGNIDAYSNDFPTLSIGHESQTSLGDSLFSDLMIAPYLVSDSVIKDHYFKNRPWYEPKEIANVDRTVKVGPGGIRMHNAALTLTDNKRRLIDISPAAGLHALDAAGNVIHDIPDALILKDMVYGGHIIWKTAPNFISGVYLDFTDVATTKTVNSALTNVNLSAYIPVGLTNIKGVLIFIRLENWISAVKVGALEGIHLEGFAFYSQKFNVVPDPYNFFKQIKTNTVEINQLHGHWDGSMALLPVVWNGDVPYLTWRTRIQFYTMSNANAQYYQKALIFLTGVLT